MCAGYYAQAKAKVCLSIVTVCMVCMDEHWGKCDLLWIKCEIIATDLA